MRRRASDEAREDRDGLSRTLHSSRFTSSRNHSHDAQMRHRRPAQRRQVHPVQRADQGGHRGGELSVLHHRAQRRHRRSARSAPGEAGRRSSSRRRSSRRSSSSSTSPGLVAGASKGEGLGNQFLANIRETDAIAHVVRCFDDDNVMHVAGKVDPVSDIEIINTELALADLATVEKQLREVRESRQGRRRQGSAAPGGGAGEGAGGARLRASRRARVDLYARREGGAQAAVPAHHEARPCTSPTWPRTASTNNPLLERVREYAREGGRAGGGDLRRARSGDRRSVR